MTGGGTSQAQTELAHNLYAFDQRWAEEITDDVVPGVGFGPSPYASETRQNEDVIIPTLNVESDITESGGYTQWTQSPGQTTVQKSILQGSHARSSLGSEPVESPTEFFEADMTNNWQYSDVEEDPVRGEAYNSQNAMRRLDENQPFNSGLGYHSMELQSTVSRGNATWFGRRIDTSLPIEPSLWPSTPDAILPLGRRPRRSMRRSNVAATRPHTQPKTHPCDRCSSAFGRAGDLRRHYRVHFPDHRTFHCWVEGCNRNGQRGFYRRDKFRDHQRQAHGFGSESELVLVEGV